MWPFEKINHLGCLSSEKSRVPQFIEHKLRILQAIGNNLFFHFSKTVALTKCRLALLYLIIMLILQGFRTTNIVCLIPISFVCFYIPSSVISACLNTKLGFLESLQYQDIKVTRKACLFINNHLLDGNRFDIFIVLWRLWASVSTDNDKWWLVL